MVTKMANEMQSFTKNLYFVYFLSSNFLLTEGEGGGHCIALEVVHGIEASGWSAE